MKHTNPYTMIFFLMILSAMSIGCIDTSTDNTIDVLVTLVPQIEMVESIGGNYVTVTPMIPPGESPHTFEPTSEQMINVAQATAYFTVGSGVEFELTHIDTILEQNPSLHIFDCSKDIEVLSYNQHYGQQEYHEQNTSEDNDEQHDHEGTDPHIWTSPPNVIKMAEVIYQGLVTIDPNNQQYYHSKYQSYLDNLTILHTTITTMLQPYKEKSFMVYHPSWGYFGDTYQLRQIAIEEEGKQPGPSGVTSIIEQAKQEDITVIFVAPQFDTSSAETIASEINGTVVYANPLMTNYRQTIIHLAEEMVNGFE